jgi:hypothetical protein
MVQALLSDRSYQPLAYPFCQGERSAVVGPECPCRKTSGNGTTIRSIFVVNERPGSGPKKASVSCWAIHSTVGLMVALIQTSRRR